MLKILTERDRISPLIILKSIRGIIFNVTLKKNYVIKQQLIISTKNSFQMIELKE